MGAWRVWLAGGLCVFGSLQAEYYPPIFDLEVGVGYRHDNYSMRVEGFVRPESNFINAEREIWRWRFDEIQIVESSASLRYTSCLNYYLRLNADYGTIHDGEGHVDGFAQFPVTDESVSCSTPSFSGSISDTCDFLHFSRINTKPDLGHVMDFSGCVGYQFRSNGRRAIVTPVVGYSWHHQHLGFDEGKQVINLFDPFPVLGDIPDLNVTYKNRWYGPFIGVDWEVLVDIPCILIFGSAEYHWTQYRATGDWNFADTFINKFTQTTRGNGIILNGGFSYKLKCNLWVTVFGTYRNFYTEQGRHKTTSLTNRLKFPRQTFGTFPGFLSDKSDHLENFKWNSYVIGLAFDYRF